MIDDYDGYGDSDERVWVNGPARACYRGRQILGDLDMPLFTPAVLFALPRDLAAARPFL